MNRARIAVKAAYFFAIVIFVDAPSYSRAESILLAEFHQTQSPVFYFSNGPNLPESILFRFQAIRETPSGTTGAQWDNDATRTGEVFSVPSTILEAMRGPMLNGTFGGRIGADGQLFDGSLDYWINKLPSTPPVDTFLNLHVSNFRNYYLTDMTRTVDNFVLEWIQVGSAYRAGGSQTVRFYGQVIPEPNILILVVIGIGLMNFSRMLNR